MPRQKKHLKRGICKLCDQEKNLIDAHIIPRFFYGKNYFIYHEKSPRKQCPIGIYDTTILCGDCDNSIGKIDRRAKLILIDKNGVERHTFKNPNNPAEEQYAYSLLDNKYYRLIEQFFLSILWRASISNREEFRQFQLGDYEDLIKELLLNPTLPIIKDFSISICYFQTFSEPIHVISSTPTLIEGVKCYIWIIGYFKLLIKLDPQDTPPRMQLSSLSEKNNLLMVESDFHHFSEAESLKELVKKSIKRPLRCRK